MWVRHYRIRSRQGLEAWNRMTEITICYDSTANGTLSSVASRIWNTALGHLSHLQNRVLWRKEKHWLNLPSGRSLRQMESKINEWKNLVKMIERRIGRLLITKELLSSIRACSKSKAFSILSVYGPHFFRLSKYLQESYTGLSVSVRIGHITWTEKDRKEGSVYQGGGMVLVCMSEPAILDNWSVIPQQR